MAQPNHAIAIHGAAPQGAIRWPALRIYEQALDEALGNPPAVSQQRQVNVDQRVRHRTPLPGRSNTAKTIDDPGVATQ